MTETIVLIIKICVSCLLAFFGAAVSIMQLINTGRFYVPFSKSMVKNGVYSESRHRNILVSRWVLSIISFIVITGITVSFSISCAPIGLYAAAACLVFGLYRYRHILTNREFNISRFEKSYSVFMNMDKYNELPKK